MLLEHVADVHYACASWQHDYVCGLTICMRHHALCAWGSLSWRTALTVWCTLITSQARKQTSLPCRRSLTEYTKMLRCHLQHWTRLSCSATTQILSCYLPTSSSLRPRSLRCLQNSTYEFQQQTPSHLLGSNKFFSVAQLLREHLHV